MTTTVAYINRTSQQIQWLVNFLFDAKFNAEYGEIERAEGESHLVADP